jgi:hypothetical protein
MRKANPTLSALVLAAALIFGACGKKDSPASGKAKCNKVKQGQSYDQVKKIFGRTEDSRRGSYLLHVHTWKFGKARCEVPFSGKAVSSAAKWHTKPAAAPPKSPPIKVDCEALNSRQEKCIDALVKLEMERSAVKEHLRKVIEEGFRNAISGPHVLSTCRREFERHRLSSYAKNKAKKIIKCLKLTDCTAYAKCYLDSFRPRKKGQPRPK